MYQRRGKAQMRLRSSTLKARRSRRGPRPRKYVRLTKVVQRLRVNVSFCANVSNCTPNKCAPTFLKNKYGKYVRLSKKSGSLKLVATDVPDGAIKSNLEIWKWNNNIAFCFKYDASEIYMVTVHEDKLKLDPLTMDSSVRDAIQTPNCWFQMVDVGNHCCCIRAANCEKYLTIYKNNRIPVVTLSDTQALDSTFTTPCLQQLPDVTEMLRA